MTKEETWTIKKLLDWTTEYFKKYNIEWPHLEAEILLAHSLKVPRIQLYVQFEKVLTSEELAEYKKLILRRSKHEPVAYIIETQPFMSLEFKVNPSVLIPRPETEKLVEITIDASKTFKSPLIADLGTGSGAIAVSLAKYISGSKIYATDVSKEAIEIAKENAEKHGVQDRCTFFVGSLFEPLEDMKGRFDIIVSNPPYVKTAEIDSLEPDIKDFEPRHALEAGEDGLKYIREIIEKSPAYLKNPGKILMEFGMGQGSTILDLAEKDGKYKNQQIIKDNSGIDRILEAEKK